MRRLPAHSADQRSFSDLFLCMPPREMCVLRNKNRCAVLDFGNHLGLIGMSSLLFLRNRHAAVVRSRLCVLPVAGHSDCRLSLSVDSRPLPALIVFRCRVSPSCTSGCGLAGSRHQFLCDFFLVVFHKSRSS